MTIIHRIAGVLGRGWAFIGASIDPYATDPYDREPFYRAALLSDQGQRPRDNRSAPQPRRRIMTAGNNLRYPPD